MSEFDQLPPVLTPKEAAEVLRCGRNGIYQLIRTGAVRSIRLGHRILIPKTAIEELLRGERREDMKANRPC